MSRLYLCHDSFINAKCIIHMVNQYASVRICVFIVCVRVCVCVCVCVCVSLLVRWLIRVSVPFISVPWLIYYCEMPHSYVWYDSFKVGGTQVCTTEDMWLYRVHVWHDSCVYMTHSYMWHDSFIYVPCLIHMCDLTHSNWVANKFASPKHTLWWTWVWMRYGIQVCITDAHI